MGLWDWAKKSVNAGSAAIDGYLDGPATKTPDFKAAAQQTSSENRPDINTPWASQQWTVGPDGRPVMSTSLSGDMQGLQKQYMDMLGGAGGARQQAEDAIYSRATSRLDPQWEARENQTRNRLLNQGIDPGAAASQRAMSDLGMQRNDAYASARNDAIVGGGQEMARNFGIGQQGIGGLYSMSTGMPGFHAGTDYLGALKAQYGWEQGQQQGRDARMGGLIQGAGSLGGSLIGLGGKIAGAS